jgi:hypothetical protein
VKLEQRVVITRMFPSCTQRGLFTVPSDEVTGERLEVSRKIQCKPQLTGSLTRVFLYQGYHQSCEFRFEEPAWCDMVGADGLRVACQEGSDDEMSDGD